MKSTAFTEIDVLTRNAVEAHLEHMAIFPASHYVVSPDKMEKAHNGDRGRTERAGQIFQERKTS